MSAGLPTEAELADVAAAMAAAGVELRGALTGRLLAGGRSNVTVHVTDGTGDWVLRMPPRVGRTPSAHDVVREYRVTSALAGTGVPVASTVALVEQDATGLAPYAVWELAPGRTLQTREQLDELNDEEVDGCVDVLVSALVELHAVDHMAVGLEGFGRPDRYAERQLRRWSGQWELVGDHSLDQLASSVTHGLAAGLPRQDQTSVVHGDYRIDNVLLVLDDGPVRASAIVDWELSTIGDPVADVAMMCAYRHPAFDLVIGAPTSWADPRLPSPAALATAYERAGGAELTDWSSHQALAAYKIAVIAAGIAHRQGAGAGVGGADRAGEAVEPFLEAALTHLRVDA